MHFHSNMYILTIFSRNFGGEIFTKIKLSTLPKFLNFFFEKNILNFGGEATFEDHLAFFQNTQNIFQKKCENILTHHKQFRPARTPGSCNTGNTSMFGIINTHQEDFHTIN